MTKEHFGTLTVYGYYTQCFLVVRKHPIIGYIIFIIIKLILYLKVRQTILYKARIIYAPMFANLF